MTAIFPAEVEFKIQLYKALVWRATQTRGHRGEKAEKETTGQTWSPNDANPETVTSQNSKPNYTTHVACWVLFAESCYSDTFCLCSFRLGKNTDATVSVASGLGLGASSPIHNFKLSHFSTRSAFWKMTMALPSQRWNSRHAVLWY